MFDRITFDPKIMGGRACIRGMRITVSLVVSLVANGMSGEEILAAYPFLIWKRRILKLVSSINSQPQCYECTHSFRVSHC
jgi:hypothetical protein